MKQATRNNLKNRARQLMFSITFILSPLIWTVLFILRLINLKPFGYIYVIYPGRPSDLDGYYPSRWIAEHIKNTIFCGIMTGEKHLGKGLVLGVPYTIKGLMKSKKISKQKKEALEKLTKLIGAKAIALTGMLPTVIHGKHKIPLNPPYVDGVRGTIFAVYSTLEEVLGKHFPKSKPKVVVYGLGRMGSRLLEYLQTKDLDVTGVDIKTPDRKQIISEADVMINFTADGKTILKEKLKEGCVIVDDTHPFTPVPPENTTLYKVVIKAPGVKFLPALTAFNSTWIPGCAWEAIVRANKDFSLMSQDEFNELSWKLGGNTPLILKKKDSLQI